jgi:hypothetical protein
MLNKLSTEEKQTVQILILMSFFSGLFISYYVSYISALFVKIVGVNLLPIAYIVSGLGGMLLTSILNKFELKYSLKTITLILLPILSASVIVVWYGCTHFGSNKIVVFLSYSWFWIIGNFILLLFWKLPGKFLSLSQNKKLTGILSSGEVISAIFAYLSIPLFLSQGLIKNESNLLWISFFGILLFFIFFLILNYNSSEYNDFNTNNNLIPDENKNSLTFYSLIKIPFLKLIFSSVVIAVLIQSAVDYSLMIVTKEIIKDSKSLASFFGFIFGCAKVFELLLKTMISNRLLKNYGVQAGIITFSLVIGITSLFGLISHLAGATTFLFIATLLNKMMERSLVRSVFTPSLSILFQVYRGKMQSIAQNFGDGQGKTYGQLIAGFLLYFISLVPSFFNKISIVYLILIASSLCLLYFASKLLPFYRDELKKRISTLINSKEGSQEILNLNEDAEGKNEVKQLKDTLYYHLLRENVRNYGQLISTLQSLESRSCKSLKIAVKEEKNQVIQQIFQILGQVNDRKILNHLFLLIKSGDQEKLVIALEILALILDNQEKVLILPIYQESSNVVILRKLEPYIPIPKRTFVETLIHLSFHHPKRYSLKTRYLALFEYIKSKEINYNHLAGACFSTEKIIQELALYHLGILYPQQLDDILERTKKKYPSKMAIEKEYSVWEA